MKLISRTTISPRPGLLHCRGPHNPIGYVGPGGLDWIDLRYIEDKITGVGASKVGSKSVVSVGRRQDGAAEKFLGLRPDFRQDGSEQMEWSFAGAEFDGKDGKVAVSNIAVWRHRQRCRMLIAPARDCRSFRIVFRLHLTGLRIEERFGEFWLFSTVDGRFRFRIREPAICDSLTQEPVRDRAGEPLRGLVRHSLVKDGDTWLYVKDSTQDFTRAVTDGLLPAGWLIDADTYYSSVADGWVMKTLIAGTWASLIQVNASGNTYSTSGSSDIYGMYARGVISYRRECKRSFFYFDTTDATSPASADFCLYGFTNGESGVAIQKGTQAATLTNSDFGKFSGSEYGRISSGWSTAGYNTISLNAQGISDINTAGETKIIAREVDHDYDGVEPGAGVSYRNGCYMTDQAGTDYDPYLSITEAAPYSPRVMIVY